MPRPLSEITINASVPWAEGLVEVKPRPGQVNRLVLRPRADGRLVPARLPRTLEDIRDWFWNQAWKMDFGCWLWPGSRNAEGYGICVVNGKQVGAHRVAYLLNYGKLPSNRLVCHHCDIPMCINPDHLFLGTNRINTLDAVIKGRKPRGEKSQAAKLTEDSVMMLRKKYSEGRVSPKELACQLGVVPQSIWNAVTGKTWSHLPILKRFRRFERARKE